MSYLLLAFAIFVLLVLLLIVVIHLGFQAPRHRETKTPADFGLEYEAAWITTVRQRRLFSWVIPGQKLDQWVVMLHGWGGNAEMMLPLARPFHEAGWSVLVFDARNHGSSDKDGISSLPRFAEDLEYVINWLQAHRDVGNGQIKVALLGHSVGAGAVLLAATRRSDITAVISLSAFAHPRLVMQRYLARRWMPAWAISVVSAYVQWAIGYRFSEIAPVKTACEVAAPVLLVHGGDDHIVPVEDARKIYERCQDQGVELYEVPGAGHTSIDRIDEHIKVLIDFLVGAGFSPAAESHTATDSPSLPKGVEV